MKFVSIIVILFEAMGFVGCGAENFNKTMNEQKYDSHDIVYPNLNHNNRTDTHHPCIQLYSIKNKGLYILLLGMFFIFFYFTDDIFNKYISNQYYYLKRNTENRTAGNLTIVDINSNKSCVCNESFLLDKYTLKHRKIFVIGFPKAGTSSLHKTFSCMGYKSAHWKTRKGYVGKLIYKARVENLPLLYYLKTFDAFAQMDYFYKGFNYMPQLDLFTDLDQEYPNSFFILNYRNLTKHYISMKGWGNIIKILNNLNLTNLPSGHGSKPDDFNTWAVRHYYNAEKYFKINNEMDRLLILDIESIEAKEILKKFFKCKKLLWIQKNKSKK